MAINKPKLDDRVFQDLMEEIKSLIPRYSGDWTNHNPSDPGITVLELFSWLAEQSLYRMNRVPESSYKKMLKIVGIDLETGESLNSGIRRARTFLEETYRAITSEDYENLVKKKMEEIQPGLAGRVIILENTDLSYISQTDSTLEDMNQAGHISILVIPRSDGDAVNYCNPEYLPARVPTRELMDEIYSFIVTRKLIATTIHVVAPTYITVDITAWVALKKNADSQVAKLSAKNRIYQYFDAIDGGPQGEGWPTGRPFYKSELLQLLDGADGVDYVEKTSLKVDGVTLEENKPVKPWEFITVGNVNIEVLGLLYHEK